MQIGIRLFPLQQNTKISTCTIYCTCTSCVCQYNTDTRNQIFSLTLNTTNIGNQTVACILLSAEECEFCYSAGDSCQNPTCIPAIETPTLLPSLTELTYSYRATASANGIAVAVIQDTFNTGMHYYFVSNEWIHMWVLFTITFSSPCLQLVSQLH